MEINADEMILEKNRQLAKLDYLKKKNIFYNPMSGKLPDMLLLMDDLVEAEIRKNQEIVEEIVELAEIRNMKRPSLWSSFKTAMAYSILD